MCHYINVFSFVLDLLNRFTENGLETRHFTAKLPILTFRLHCFTDSRNHCQRIPVIINCDSSLKDPDPALIKR